MVLKINISAPFIHSSQTTKKIMLQTTLACLPGAILLIYFFGSGVIIQCALGCMTAIIFEGVVAILRKQTFTSRFSDCSSILTALLIALSIPPLSPWWMMVLAIFFAIIIAKQIYGGLGHNPFNPAMVGYVVLLISFPVQMTSWLPKQSLLPYSISFIDNASLIFTGKTLDGLTITQICTPINGVTQATPLDKFKTKIHKKISFILDYRCDCIIDAEYLWINISFLLGGIYLIWQRIISWYISISFITAMFISSILEYLLSSTINLLPLEHLFSGATMLGAFFIATDPVTSTITIPGKVVLGTYTGVLIWLIRTYGGYPDGVAFSVLLANICVPFIDHYTQPRVYGH